MRRPFLALPLLLALALVGCSTPRGEVDIKAGGGVYFKRGDKVGLGVEAYGPTIKVGPAGLAHPVTGEAPKIDDPAPVPAPAQGDARMAPQPRGTCVPGDPNCRPPEPVGSAVVYESSPAEVYLASMTGGAMPFVPSEPPGASSEPTDLPDLGATERNAREADRMKTLAVALGVLLVLGVAAALLFAPRRAVPATRTETLARPPVQFGS
jgi:hypothetical protein